MEKEGLISSFIVKFDQLSEIKFRSCLGMQFQISPKYYRDSSSIGGYSTARGEVGISEVSFSYGTVEGTHSGAGSQSVTEWLFSVINPDKALEKRNGRVSLCSSTGEVVAQWKILKAWPCRWEGPQLGTTSSSLSIDTITFAHEGLERLK